MKQETIKRILSSIIIIPIALFFIIKGSFFFIFFTSIFFLVTAYEWYQMSNKKKYLYPGLIFLFFSTYTAYLFRNDNNNDAFLLFLIVILTCVATDIGGYVFGKIFKGPKLIKISPNKTYAGMLGGFFLSIISVNIFLNYAQLLEFNYIEFTPVAFILVLLISTISQIGDLVMSYFKRKSKIKNTGKILPGHGGLLDRVDGLIFAVPFAYLLFKLI
jgi:phosphatidate cytidylyltransferase